MKLLRAINRNICHIEGGDRRILVRTQYIQPLWMETPLTITSSQEAKVLVI